MKKLSFLLFLFATLMCCANVSAAGYCYEFINPDGNGDNDAAYFSWNTESNGDITVWITGVPGNTETAFRNNGMPAGDFWVAGSDVTFSHSINAEKTKITLTPSATLTNDNEIIYNAAVEYRTSTTTAPYDNLFPTLSFIFTYGETCTEIVPTPLERPTSLAFGITDNVLTFDSDINAGSNTVTVYRESSLLPVYVQTDFSSGDVLNFTESGSYEISVQSLTNSLDYTNSEASIRLPVTIPGEPVIPAAGASEYCDYPVGSGVDAALLTWETADDGSIIITMSGVDGDAGTMFRAPGMSVENFKVNSYSGNWFDTVLNDERTEITLTPKVPLINGDVITYSGYVEYTTSAGNALWPTLSFTYTYGNTCLSVKSVGAATAITTNSATVTVTTTAGSYAVTQIKFVEDNGLVADITLSKTANNTYLLEGLSPNTSYSFTVTAIDSNGDESAPFATKLAFKTQTSTSAAEISGASVSISPIPAKNVITINGVGTPASAILMTVQGTVVLEAENQRTVDVSGLNAGLYLARIVDKAGNQYLEKVLIK